MRKRWGESERVRKEMCERYDGVCMCGSGSEGVRKKEGMGGESEGDERVNM